MVGMLALSLLIAQAAAMGGFSAPCIVPVVEYGVVRNESSGSTLSHGEKLTFDCINSYQPAHGLFTSICNNGTWNVIPRCEPGTDILIGLLPMLATTTIIMKTATMHKECGLNYFVKSDGKVSIHWTRLPLVTTADTLRFTDQEHLGDSQP